MINYQWSRHRGTHHVIGLHQDSCITHSSLYSQMKNRYICSWSVHLKVAFRLQSKTFCTSKVWPKWHILYAYSLWRIVSAWALQIYEAKKERDLQWMELWLYAVHYSFQRLHLEINRINWPFIAKLKIPTHWNCEMNWLWFYCFDLHLITRDVFCCDGACCSFVRRVGEGQRWLDSKWVFCSHATMEVKEKARCVLEISEADLGEEVQ